MAVHPPEVTVQEAPATRSPMVEFDLMIVDSITLQMEANSLKLAQKDWSQSHLAVLQSVMRQVVDS